MNRNRILVHNSYVFVALHFDTKIMRPQWPGKNRCLCILIPLWKRVRLEVAFLRASYV